MKKLESIRNKKSFQYIFALIIGIAFGFLLNKGGVTKYEIIIKQLLLEDFTVVRIMLSAVVTGMIGIYLMKDIGIANLHPKPGSFGMSVIGGLIFGAGFAVLGYCPGTIAGAVGQGSLDALIGGITGILLGAGIFSSIYPRLARGILNKGYFGEITFPELLKVNHWIVIIPLVIIIILGLYFTR